MLVILSKLTTEQRNEASENLDKKSIEEILKIINDEDKQIAYAIEKELKTISILVEKVYQSLSRGGRLFYIGAGTSGRLGVMDSSECVPTFMVPKDMIQTIMAGGRDAFEHAIEGAEDDEIQGELDLKERDLTNKDVVMGIKASGRTPSPIGALKYARKIGAYAIALTSNENAKISQVANISIEVVVGPEILTGSTRMKAATSHKMVLKMISTTVMVRLGKVYENLMIDVNANNIKLRERAKHIVMEITEASYYEAERVLKAANYKVKIAIVMILSNLSYEEAVEKVNKNKGHIRGVIEG